MSGLIIVGAISLTSGVILGTFLESSTSRGSKNVRLFSQDEFKKAAEEEFMALDRQIGSSPVGMIMKETSFVYSTGIEWRLFGENDQKEGDNFGKFDSCWFYRIYHRYHLRYIAGRECSTRRGEGETEK